MTDITNHTLPHANTLARQTDRQAGAHAYIKVSAPNTHTYTHTDKHSKLYKIEKIKGRESGRSRETMKKKESVGQKVRHIDQERNVQEMYSK